MSLTAFKQTTMLHLAPYKTVPVLSCPIAWLRQGVTGAAVIDLQQRLQQQGFHPGAIDGNFGVRTHTAVYRFQFAQALALTGGVDDQTWQRLKDAA